MIEYFKEQQLGKSNKLHYVIYDYDMNPCHIHIEIKSIDTSKLEGFDFSKYEFVKMFNFGNNQFPVFKYIGA